MMPEHCKEVSSKRVVFPLDPGSIARELKGKKIYRLTRYLILRNGEDLAVVRLSVDPEGDRRSLFRQITGTEIISLPENTIYLELPGQDVLDEAGSTDAVLAALQDGQRGKRITAVIKGKFEHISFLVVDGLTEAGPS